MVESLSEGELEAAVAQTPPSEPRTDLGLPGVSGNLLLRGSSDKKREHTSSMNPDLRLWKPTVTYCVTLRQLFTLSGP